MVTIRRINICFGFLIFGLALLLFGVPGDTLACHKGTPHGQDTDCGGGGGGDGGGGGGGSEQISNVPIDVQWVSPGSPGISEPQPRPCTLSSAQASYGSYHCQHIGAAPVTYDLTGIARAQIARKGDAAFCDSFDGITLEPTSSYQVDWTEACDDNSACTIRILNWAFGDEVSSKIPGADTARVEAFADAHPPFSNPNPFADSRLLDIDEIVITFTGDGNNKTVAKCRFTGIDSGAISFQSIPAL
jgi:hypothetical protein